MTSIYVNIYITNVVIRPYSYRLWKATLNTFLEQINNESYFLLKKFITSTFYLLSRAVYRKADVYLLDDPLSAVDTKVAKHIFEK